MSCECMEFAVGGASGGAGGGGAAGTSYRWVWADATARNAQTVTALDVGKTGFQTDMELEYKLVQASPAKWGALLDPRYGAVRTNLADRGLTTFTSVGLVISQTEGAVAARAPTTATRSTMLERVTLATTAVAGTAATRRVTTGTTYLVSKVLGTGWRFTLNFVIGITSTNSRLFCGICQGAGGNVDPNTFLNSIGVGRSLSTETNLQLYRNGTAGTATKVDLGASFPFVENQGYRVEIFTKDSTTWAWQITNVDTGAQVSGSASDTKVPGNTLSPHHHVNNNTDAVLVQIDAGDTQSWPLWVT